MTGCTGRPIQFRFLAAVLVDEMRSVIGGLKRRDIIVAFLTGERRVDFAVADEAIRHLGKYLCHRDILGMFNTMVAAGAGDLCVQVRRWS